MDVVVIEKLLESLNHSVLPEAPFPLQIIVEIGSLNTLVELDKTLLPMPPTRIRYVGGEKRNYARSILLLSFRAFLKKV